MAAQREDGPRRVDVSMRFVPAQRAPEQPSCSGVALPLFSLHLTKEVFQSIMTSDSQIIRTNDEPEFIRSCSLTSKGQFVPHQDTPC